jgi:hypothetical protein
MLSWPPAMTMAASPSWMCGDDDGGVAELDVLGADCDRAQARAADLVDAPGGRFDRQSGIDMRLAGRVLALAGGQYLAEDGLGHISRIDPGALQSGLDGGRAQVVRGRVGEGSVEAADGCTRRRGDDDVGRGAGHGGPFSVRSRRFCRG